MEDIEALKRENNYNVWNIYDHNERLRMVIESLRNRTWDPDSNAFMHIYNDLMLRNDEFYVLADFEAYLYAQSLVAKAYEDRRAWARIMLINIAKSGYFSSDRTIQEYAREIWGLTPIPFDHQKTA